MVKEFKKVLIALGGNAIKSAKNRESYERQIERVEKTAEEIAKVVKKGYKIVITHGNGPQVGDILLQQEFAKEYVFPMPLSICGAQSQGQIGCMLEEAVFWALKKLRVKKEIVSIITHVLVDSQDSAFLRPAKPIGPIYTPDEANEYRKRGIKMKEIMPGAYRRVVASPVPKEIIEIKTIKKLFNSDNIVIAVGGGGVPVILKNGKLKGVEAVIDKDLASELLAISLGVDVLMILTDVKKVALNFNKPNETRLDSLTVNDAKRYLREGQFPAGSMGPKVEAAIKFIKKGGRKAVIARLDDLLQALEGRAGTVITKN